MTQASLTAKDRAVATDDIGALATRAAEGDRTAFSTLVRTVQEPLFYAVLRQVAHPHDARDIVQKTLLRAWARAADLDAKERWRSWVFSIALNLARNHRRDTGRRQYDPVEENTLTVGPEALHRMTSRETRTRLRRALTLLPDRQREGVSLRIDAELSYREIGQAVGCSEGSARVSYHHGMKRLRQLLTRDDSPGGSDA